MITLFAGMILGVILSVIGRAPVIGLLSLACYLLTLIVLNNYAQSISDYEVSSYHNGTAIKQFCTGQHSNGNYYLYECGLKTE